MNTKEIGIEYVQKKYGRVNKALKIFIICMLVFMGIIAVGMFSTADEEPKSFDPFSSYTGPAYTEAWIAEGPFATSDEDESYYIAYTEDGYPFVIIEKGNHRSVPVYGMDFDDYSYPEDTVRIQGKQMKIESDLVPFIVYWFEDYFEEGEFTENNYDEYVGSYCLNLNETGNDDSGAIIPLVIIAILLIILICSSMSAKKKFKKTIESLRASGEYSIVDSELRSAHTKEYKKLRLFVTDNSVIYAGNDGVIRIAYEDMINVYSSNIIGVQYDYHQKCITVEKKVAGEEGKYTVHNLSKVKREYKKSDYEEVIKTIKSRITFVNPYFGTSNAFNTEGEV